MVVVVEERPSAQAERVISDQVKGRVAEQAEFQREVLGHRLQDQIRAGQGFIEVAGEGNPLQHRVSFLGCEFASLHRPTDAVPTAADPFRRP